MKSIQREQFCISFRSELAERRASDTKNQKQNFRIRGVSVGSCIRVFLGFFSICMGFLRKNTKTIPKFSRSFKKISNLSKIRSCSRTLKGLWALIHKDLDQSLIIGQVLSTDLALC